MDTAKLSATIPAGQLNGGPYTFAKIARPHFALGDGRPQHLGDKWAAVDANGKVMHLDLDRARAMAVCEPTSPFYDQQIPRAIAALIVEAFERGRASVAAGDGYNWRAPRDAA